MRTIVVLTATLAVSLPAGCRRSSGGSQPPPSSATKAPSSAAHVAAVGGAPAGPYTGDAIVAVVKQVDDANATYGNPPLVRLDVLEVLRGDPNADRTWAIWTPPDHNIDTGVIEKNPRYRKWARAPMKGPKVGEKYILWGWNFTRHGRTRFLARLRTAFSDKARQAAIRMIEWQGQQAEAYRKQVEAREAAHRAAVRRWRQRVSPDDIKRYAGAAEFVGIGKFSGAMIGPSDNVLVDFAISSILKGRQQKQFTVPAYFVTFVIARKLYNLLDREKQYVVFLRVGSKTLSASAASCYRIPQGDGIVIADKQARKALAGYVGRTPSSTTQPATTRPGEPPTVRPQSTTPEWRSRAFPGTAPGSATSG